jgi:hypothetical protein
MFFRIGGHLLIGVTVACGRHNIRAEELFNSKVSKNLLVLHS